MTPASLLALAERLALGADDTDWRSAVSRGYYAAFHATRDFLGRCKFVAPKADRSHAYLHRRLKGSGDAALVAAGRDLEDLRTDRNKADYDVGWKLNQGTATALVARARTIIETLALAEADPPRLAAIVAAIRTHEAAVLKEVTWQGP